MKSLPLRTQKDISGRPQMTKTGEKMNPVCEKKLAPKARWKQVREKNENYHKILD